MSTEHPIEQKIQHILISDRGLDNGYEPRSFAVSYDGVTHMEACTKSGMHADIPYIRVWAGDHCLGEFCQHNLMGLWFAEAPHG